MIITNEELENYLELWEKTEGDKITLNLSYSSPWQPKYLFAVSKPSKKERWACYDERQVV